MLRDHFGSDYDYEAAMRYDAPAPPKRPFVVCRRCLRDDADTNQATCRCCGGELQRYREAPEPAIDLTVDWPGESMCARYTRWAPVFDIMARFAHVRQSRITVHCEDPDGDTEVRIQYLPNQQEINFNLGAYEQAVR